MRICPLLVLLAVSFTPTAFAQELLNASYDVSRELFDEINPWRRARQGPARGTGALIKR